MGDATGKYDLKFHLAGQFLQELRLPMHVGALEPVTRLLFRNIDRVAQLWWVQACIAGFSAEWEMLSTIARLSLVTLEKPSDYLALPIPADPEFEAKVLAERGRIIQFHRGFGIVQNVVWKSIDAMRASTAPQFQSIHTGLRTVLDEMIIAGWTAIETYAGDLWEDAINAHPWELSELKNWKGKRDKFPAESTKGKANDASASSDEDLDRRSPKVPIPIPFLKRKGYDLTNLMGSALRSEFKFTTLPGIRTAYEAAFWKRRELIDEALKDRCLDRLSLVRNLVIHKGGICDEEYERRAKGVGEIPLLKIGEPLLVDGALVKDLLAPAFACAFKLLAAVDSWIVRDRIERNIPSDIKETYQVAYDIPGWASDRRSGH